MRKHEILPHTADLRIKIEGHSLPELFLAALEGMASVIKNRESRQRRGSPVSPRRVEAGPGAAGIMNHGTIVEDTVEISSPDETSLLIDFLSEVLTRTHQKKVVFFQAEFENLDTKKLKVKIFGQKVEEFDEDIKAVTYHEANIIKNVQGNYETNIVFDI